MDWHIPPVIFPFGNQEDGRNVVCACCVDLIEAQHSQDRYQVPPNSCQNLTALRPASVRARCLVYLAGWSRDTNSRWLLISWISLETPYSPKTYPLQRASRTMTSWTDGSSPSPSPLPRPPSPRGRQGAQEEEGGDQVRISASGLQNFKTGFTVLAKSRPNYSTRRL